MKLEMIKVIEAQRFALVVLTDDLAGRSKMHRDHAIR